MKKDSTMKDARKNVIHVGDVLRTVRVSPIWDDEYKTGHTTVYLPEGTIIFCVDLGKLRQEVIAVQDTSLIWIASIDVEVVQHA